MVTIRYVDAARTRGVITLDDGREVWTVLPPEDGEMRAIYDAFLTSKGVVAPSPTAASAALPDLTDRQFGEGLWRDGLIGFEDYLAFVGPGVIPGPLMDLLDALPNDDGGDPNAVTPRRVAIGLATGAQTYLFENPLVDLIRQNKGWTVEHLRERWAAWAAL